jgi:hypothetical protein
MSANTDPQSSSEYSDMEMGVSEAEVLSSEWDQDAEMQRDYWFGKKYLECIAAQDLLQRTSPHETVAGIDVCKTLQIESSYRDCSLINSAVEIRNRNAALSIPSAFGGTTSSRNISL